MFEKKLWKDFNRRFFFRNILEGSSQFFFFFLDIYGKRVEKMSIAQNSGFKEDFFLLDFSGPVGL